MLVPNELFKQKMIQNLICTAALATIWYITLKGNYIPFAFSLLFL